MMKPKTDEQIRREGNERYAAERHRDEWLRRDGRCERDRQRFGEPGAYPVRQRFATEDAGEPLDAPFADRGREIDDAQRGSERQLE